MRMMSRANFFWKWLYTLIIAVLIVSCSEKEDDPKPQPEENNLVEATGTGSWGAAQLKLFVQLSGRDLNTDLLAYDVDIYRVTYKTTYQEEEINASGLILLPKTTGNALPMISFQRGTIVELADAPSLQAKESQQVISYSALASMGFITVVPDMIGFGESNEIFHPYYVEEPTSTAVIDMLYAARALADEKKTWTLTADCFWPDTHKGDMPPWQRIKASRPRTRTISRSLRRFLGQADMMSLPCKIICSNWILTLIRITWPM